jgi:hypothetical protein
MDTTQPIQFRVKGIKTEANGGEGSESLFVEFRLSGYASEDFELSSQTYGDDGIVYKSVGSIDVPQHSVYITDWSGDVIIPNITNNTINQIRFYRNITTDFNYIHDIAVIEIEIRISQ